MLQIMLVEDNRSDVLLVRQALAKHQLEHELQVARDGAEALDLLAQMGQPGQAPCPHVLLLDLNLPKVDGPQVLQAFRQHPACGQTPVIVVTSSDASKDRERLNQLGISHYFRKPLDLEAFLQLGAVVREALASRGTSSH